MFINWKIQYLNLSFLHVLIYRFNMITSISPACFSVEINNKFCNLYGNAKRLEYPNNSFKKDQSLRNLCYLCPGLYNYNN